MTLKMAGVRPADVGRKVLGEVTRERKYVLHIVFQSDQDMKDVAEILIRGRRINISAMCCVERP